MTNFVPTRFAAGFLAAAALTALPVSSQAFLGLFKKEEKVAPATNQRQAQEAQAAAMLAEARAAQSDGRTGRAVSGYNAIIKQYPFTDAAAEAAYAKALITRQNESVSDAFDAFQDFIKDHRSSARFDDAIQQQYELAEEARGGRRQRTVILIPMKLGGEEVIEMYKKIIENAPFGKLAPLAQMSIAEIYQDLGEKDKAVLAYQLIVDNYPNTKHASEAQFRIGSISNVAASRSEDKSNLTSTRDALNMYMASHPKGERVSEAEMILRQVNADEANQSLQVGKFYQKMGKTKAAAIYYNEALKYGSPEASAEARTLLGELAAIDPDAVADAKRGQPNQDYTTAGASNLKRRADYVGPMAPELARLGEKPRMRAGDDGFIPIPVQEPSLPTKPGAAPDAGTLLPPPLVPPFEERPALLPVPGSTPAIAPEPAGALPVPPKPAP
jgi:outer membrane protein assembly factor BamD (BamD/ComL family)